jgi:hypothetical protein
MSMRVYVGTIIIFFVKKNVKKSFFFGQQHPRHPALSPVPVGVNEGDGNAKRLRARRGEHYVGGGGAHGSALYQSEYGGN